MLYLSGAVRKGMPAMLSMGMGNRPPDGQVWAADSGRYNNAAAYTDAKYLAWLERHAWARDRCLFATAPDVVGDARETMRLSVPMFGRIRLAGYPVALVAQDGLELMTVPWALFDVLFIGGTTVWKTSPAVRQLCADAKRHGKWLHMGRVNSYRRMQVAFDYGCDSVDGTKIAFGPDENEPKIRRWLARIHSQLSLWS